MPRISEVMGVFDPYDVLGRCRRVHDLCVEGRTVQWRCFMSCMEAGNGISSMRQEWWSRTAANSQLTRTASETQCATATSIFRLPPVQRMPRSPIKPSLPYAPPGWIWPRTARHSFDVRSRQPCMPGEKCAESHPRACEKRT